ncbi:MAG: protein-methionine-sulfoxide reductase catalytic subunit MsrP [Anaerolineae bacterium]|nr:protein-methionine-sulfoxide reductase catalytic subunit MsrP [Anaerolineae bacterium]
MTMDKIRPSEITPEWVYLSRRRFMRGIGASVAGALLAACAPRTTPSPAAPAQSPAAAPTITPPTSLSRPPTTAVPATPTSEPHTVPDTLTPFDAVTNYNNFFEFSTEKETVAALAQGFRTSPWTVTIGGLVNRPLTLGIEDLLRKYPQEERIYRLRCVEGWSMVIPWLGFPLASLLKEAEPLSAARYVRFETLLDPEQMPGQRARFFPWPYVEGLRLDEAMHNLTILSTGLYGKMLLPQNGAPLRLVVPWKYGFKSIKSIVKIELVEEQPKSFWMILAADEYGFYANVNPDVDHPRWSQKRERRIGELRLRPTLPFNGYAEEVAHLYSCLFIHI